MTRFVAVPVGQGDSFYLETSEGSVLVDGGRSVRRISSLFRRYAKRDGVDILVATHNDADHANGVLGFLQSGLRCEEVWLPGRWAQVLPHVLRPWEEVVHLFREQVIDAIHRHPELREMQPPLLERYAEFIVREFDVRSQETEAGEELNELGWSPTLISLLERASEDDEFWLFPWPRSLWLWEWLWEIPPRYPEARLFMEALVAASRIRKIAIEAYHRGITVRWFEFSPGNPGGGQSWLQPLNSRQVARVASVPVGMFLMALALTVPNRESLVFWAPKGMAGPGVLFTADSDLRGIQLPPLEGAIITAPHHGSEANKEVYQRIRAPVIWVRSDRKSRRRPCREYLQALGRRFCTICRGSSVSKQAVFLYACAQTWIERNTYPCSCR